MSAPLYDPVGPHGYQLFGPFFWGAVYCFGEPAWRAPWMRLLGPFLRVEIRLEWVPFVCGWEEGDPSIGANIYGEEKSA